MGVILQELAQGIPITLWVAVCAWVLCSVVGLIVSGLSRSKLLPLRAIGDFITMFFRGVPELVALFVVYFGLVQFVALSPVVAAILAFGLIESPFASEIFRAALTTVERGQRDAAESIGLPRWKTLVFVVVPQAVRFAVAPMLNLFIGMLNLSSVAAAIGVADVIARGQSIMSSGSGGSLFFEVTIGIAIIYLGLVIPFSLLARLVERRFSHGASVSKGGGLFLRWRAGRVVAVPQSMPVEPSART